jgi:hypothetical protein
VNWDRIEGQWKQRRGKAVHHLGKMMNDELAAIAGKYEEHVGRLQGQYRIAKKEAKCEIDEYAIHTPRQQWGCAMVRPCVEN